MVTFSTLKFNFSSPKQVIGCGYLLVTGFDEKLMQTSIFLVS